ncbi:hypothetical protein [Brucella intermedia]|uniref:hypothetical protein n=1 Tax=Brucella intermedia TaxID=94625 RepID=UPI00165CF62A|nr:hypothetical protein [Brucella intermedia]QNQ40578.1 hypothetical protein IAR37_01710 [Brucella intermedia]
MTKRIKYSPEGVYVSRPGYDVETASLDKMSMYPGMGVMAQVLEGAVTLAGETRQDFPFTNPAQKLPYVILNSTSGEHPDRGTFCAEVNPPYNYVRIRNEKDQPTRTIRFVVLIDNT